MGFIRRFYCGPYYNYECTRNIDGSSSASRPPWQDLYSLFIRKMQDAPPQEVTIVGEDWEASLRDTSGSMDAHRPAPGLGDGRAGQGREIQRHF